MAAAAQRSGRGGGSAATMAVQQQRGGGTAAARRQCGVGGSRGGSLAAARWQRGGGGSFPSAWRRWQKHGGSDGGGGGGSAAAVVAGWQQRGGIKQRGVVFLCKRMCLAPLASCTVSKKPQRHKDFLRRREGQTTHYGLHKILCCTATKGHSLYWGNIYIFWLNYCRKSYVLPQPPRCIYVSGLGKILWPNIQVDT